MRKNTISILLLFVIASLLLAQCGGSATSSTEPEVILETDQPTTAQDETSLPETAPAIIDAATFTEDTCSQCHSFSNVSNSGRSTEQWASTVDRMISHGLTLSAEERQIIVDYLGQTYP